MVKPTHRCFIYPEMCVCFFKAHSQTSEFQTLPDASVYIPEDAKGHKRPCCYEVPGGQWRAEHLPPVVSLHEPRSGERVCALHPSTRVCIYLSRARSLALHRSRFALRVSRVHARLCAPPIATPRPLLLPPTLTSGTYLARGLQKPRWLAKEEKGKPKRGSCERGRIPSFTAPFRSL